MTFVRARWFTETNGRQIDLLVVHSMEYPEKGDSAEAIAAYFAAGAGGRKASAHECADTNSRVTCVLDKDVAYAAPGANHNGLHLELAGYARQTRAAWLDPYSRSMLTGPAADWTREKARAYGIPLTYLPAAKLLGPRPRGVTTHNEVRLAFGLTTHTDPGAGFPMDVLLAAALAGAAPPPPHQEDPMADRTLIPSWAKRDPKTNRAPFFRLNPADPTPGEGNACYVVAYNGAVFSPGLEQFGWEVGVYLGAPFVKLRRLAAPAIALAEVESTGAVVVVAEDGGIFDVARRP